MSVAISRDSIASILVFHKARSLRSLTSFHRVSKTGPTRGRRSDVVSITGSPVAHDFAVDFCAAILSGLERFD